MVFGGDVVFCLPDKTLLISVRCFSRILLFNVFKSIIVMDSIDTRFSRNVFEAIQKTRSTCFIGSKTTQPRLVVLNPINTSARFLSITYSTPSLCFFFLFLFYHFHDKFKRKLPVSLTSGTSVT